ncbi:MAG: hypothetical protein LBJ31_03260 [Treponema sp.]|nr:hypothetical protein [Treponema sp.]
MKSTLKKKLRFFCAAALFAAALPAGAQSFWQQLEWSLRGSILLFPESNGNRSAPMPILPSLGAGASYTLSDFLALETSLDIYGNTYDYDYTLDRVVPANDEFRSAFALGLVLGFQPVMRFRPFGEKKIIRAYGGLAFDIRIVFPAYGIESGEDHTNQGGSTGHSVGDAKSAINSYFWGSGRWLLPFIGGGMDFRFLDDLLLGFDLRLWIPAYRLWSGEDLPFVEGFRIGISIKVTFS